MAWCECCGDEVPVSYVDPPLFQDAQHTVQLRITQADAGLMLDLVDTGKDRRGPDVVLKPYGVQDDAGACRVLRRIKRMRESEFRGLINGHGEGN